ncbi:rod shape-determining protein MreC [Thermoflavifilum aggregans]|uniref:Cell shape-determining protein MreC n=1 Tax=Thermoflavifilum aggregans TaxID=454188 RepID=A0A2M9CT71_9BACT|nr:rod shape-determining protein MreC [Thermoflavifilum aggregans]MBX6379243.1 rod shape-determining protein MreC [Thermoflavifilum aggregans]PJJ75093.1 rod shape-determining protein MreC [Thermoflavifilum aggregans]
MRNLILFIRRYFNLLLFIAIEAICLNRVFSQNPFQQAWFLQFSEEWMGRLYQHYADVMQYFHLKQVNESLLAENARLRNQLLQDFSFPDTSRKLIRDTAQHRQYAYLPAEVVNNSIVHANNYITIHRGRLEGVHAHMGVVSSQGVAGVVVRASDHYALVMSLLHKDFRLSVRLKRTGDIGYVRWDGEDPATALFSDIPRSVTLYKNDTVVTSGFSVMFPPGIVVGYVEKVAQQPASNFQVARIRLATPFSRLRYVYVIENLQAPEQLQVESNVVSP